MKKKLFIIISSLVVLTGIVSVITASSNPLLRLGVIESLTGGDRLEDILIPDSRTISYTMEPPLYFPGYGVQYKTSIEHVANFTYAGVHYSFPFTAHTQIQVTCCGNRWTGYDDCAAWSSDTSYEMCPYYWHETSDTRAYWFKYWY